MFYVVGLGNPGKEYVGTRHNAGRSFLEYAAKQNDFSDWKFDKKLNALISTGVLGNLPAGKAGKKITFILPETFMNNSGNSVRALKLAKKDFENLVVCYDDLDLSSGSLKISFNRGSGGHNGLNSIIKALKSEAFPRIRFGVSPSTASGKTKKPSGEEKVIKFLMTKFRENEMSDLKKVWKKAVLALEVMASESLGKAMSIYNN